MAPLPDLPGVDGLLRQAEAVSRPRLDLDEDQRRPILHHQVQLTERRPDVPANDLVTETTQVVLGQRLAASPERFGWQWRPLPGRRACGSRWRSAAATATTHGGPWQPDGPASRRLW